MKKLMVLNTRSLETRAVALKLISCEISIHFARNPIEGGSPERLEDTMIGNHVGRVFISFRLFLIFDSLIIHMVIITEAQYRITKIRVIFMFDRTAMSIHLRLKIEERAMYSISFCLFSCERDPVRRLIMIPVMIILFEMKIDK
jgi:hypothetical protein